MMKSHIAIAILIFSSKVNIYAMQKQKYFKLESDYFKFLDGVPNCFDKGAIWEMQYLRSVAHNLREKGILDPKTKERLMLNNIPHSISELIVVEEKNDINDIPKLKECLKKAKNAYIKLTENIRKRIGKVRKVFGEIIKESCDKRNIKLEDSLLLEWADIKINEEFVFYNKIKTFKDLDIFLLQFYNFLGDMVFSCPKGYEQYKKEFSQIAYKAKKHYE